MVDAGSCSPGNSMDIQAETLVFGEKTPFHHGNLPGIIATCIPTSYVTIPSGKQIQWALAELRG